MEELTWPRFSPAFHKASKTDMSQPGFESLPPASQAGTPSKSYLDSLHIWLFWSATWLPQCMERTLTHISSVHQMIASRSPVIKHLQVIHPWVIMQLQAIRMFKSRRGYHYGGTWPKFSPSFNTASWDRHVSAKIQTPAAYIAGGYSTKELSR